MAVLYGPANLEAKNVAPPGDHPAPVPRAAPNQEAERHEFQYLHPATTLRTDQPRGSFRYLFNIFCCPFETSRAELLWRACGLSLRMPICRQCGRHHGMQCLGSQRQSANRVLVLSITNPTPLERGAVGSSQPPPALSLVFSVGFLSLEPPPPTPDWQGSLSGTRLGASQLRAEAGSFHVSSRGKVVTAWKWGGMGLESPWPHPGPRSSQGWAVPPRTQKHPAGQGLSSTPTRRHSLAGQRARPTDSADMASNKEPWGKQGRGAGDPRPCQSPHTSLMPRPFSHAEATGQECAGAPGSQRTRETREARRGMAARWWGLSTPWECRLGLGARRGRQPGWRPQMGGENTGGLWLLRPGDTIPPSPHSGSAAGPSPALSPQAGPSWRAGSGGR